MLDGECKIEFETFFLLRSRNSVGMVNSGAIQIGQNILEVFYALPESMQWGVEVDFFDSVDILVSIEMHFVGDPRYDSDAGYRFEVCIDEDTYSMYRTRKEARSAAKTKANELFNLRSKA